MNLTKEKITGFIGSLIFCIIMILVLWFSVLKTIIPTEEIGTWVNFGNIDEASGMFEPMNTGENNLTESDIPNIPEQPILTSTPEETAITQNLEQTVSIDAENKRIEEEKRQQAELEHRQQAINSQVAGAFGIGNTPSEGQGTGTGQGNQGISSGNSDYGEVALAGRRLIGSLPRPAFSVQEEGTIVVDITVDKNGNVISTTIGRGTNIDNATLRRSTLEAAKKAKFNPIEGNENSSGKITYRYYLK